MVLVLTGITAICVALLAYVNELTKEPIAAANAKTLSDAVKAVVPGFTNDPIADKKTQEVNGVTYAIYPASKDGEFLGAAVEASAMGLMLKVKSMTILCCHMLRLRDWAQKQLIGLRKVKRVISQA